MIALNDVQIKSQTQIGNTLYINTLPEQSEGYVELMILAAHRQTGEEQTIDALLPDDRLSTVLNVIRTVLGASWTICETWEPEEVTQVLLAA